MDSAKKQKLFPELRARDFTDFVKAAPGSTEFTLPSSFWESLDRDPGLREEFEQRVVDRARALLQDEAAPARDKVFEETRQKGLAQGLAEGQAAVQAACTALESCAADLVKQKAQLMRSHEKEWAEAFSHAMRRFLVPLSAERFAGLQTWLEESLGQWEKDAKFRVAVCPTLRKELAERLPTEQVPHFEWVEDKELGPQEFRVEMVGGGIFFSAETQWAHFEEKLNELLGATKS